MFKTIIIMAVRLVAKTARKLLKGLAYFGLITLLVSTIVIQTSGDKDFRFTPVAPVVNDVTGLNPVSVERVIQPLREEEIVSAITTTKGPVSIGGGRYSQGGQIAYEDSLHIDMRAYKQVLAFDAEAREITVQSGISWRDLQAYIDPHDLSVRIMQTYSNFTVGGSLSVNVHGRYIGEGPLVHSVKSIKLVLADGAVVSATPDQNSELFFGAIGGYGGLGVIVEATLLLTENTAVERRVKPLAVADYYEYFTDNIRNNSDVVFHNADLYPPDYQQGLGVSWFKTDKAVTINERLISTDAEYYWRPRIAAFVANYDIGKKFRQFIVDPLLYRTERIVWRNWEASYDVRELEPEDRDDKTYVLREYFVPVRNFDRFVPKMAEIFRRNDANIINVSVRHAHKDPGTLLAWAREEMFAFVVYYQQGTDRVAMDEVKTWSLEMIDAVIENGGTYYLPYQVLASPEQFAAAYPDSAKFFALKARLDPDYRFRNRLWQQHYNGEQVNGAEQSRIKNYRRGEEQTYLTIPEWYLVFNPLEYAEFLESGRSPSEFPFFASIDEYWKLYDRARVITAGRYPANSEYLTMLRVIGVSTSIEYLYKGLYEQTIGRLTRWTAGGEETPEDLIIRQAQRAYSDLIFDTAWYEFDFSGWLGRIWWEPSFIGENFVRKLERKLFFTLEFGFKSLYAKLVGFGAKTAYEASDGLVYLTASVPEGVQRTLPQSVKKTFKGDGAQILAVPRWGGFTKVIPELVRMGVQFKDISGNSRIVVQLRGPASQAIELVEGETLFSAPLVSNNSAQRIYLNVRVDKLHRLLREAETMNLNLEHIYDY